MKKEAKQTREFILGEIFRFLPKSRRKAGDGLPSGRYQFFTSSQQQTKWLDKADYTENSIILGTGGAASVHHAINFSTSTDVFVLAPANNNVLAKFVYYYLLGHKNVLERGFKGAGLRHLSRSYVQNLQIPLPVDRKGNPDLAEQERVVVLLEEVERLKKKRAEANQIIDEIVPALYMGLSKEGDWPKKKIVDVVANKTSVRTGPFGSQLRHSEFTDEGIPVLGIDNVVTNRFQWAKPRFLPIEKYNKFKRFRVYPGDVLVTIMGTVGRACVAPADLPESMSTKHLCVITPDHKRVNPVYLWGSFLYDVNIRHQTKNVAKGAIMEGWNSTIIKNLLISVPPVALQNQFAEKVKEIEAQKERQKRSMVEIDDLFSSLLYRAFS